MYMNNVTASMFVQEEVTIAKEEWELSRLQALKEEEERRAELEEDEMLFTYTRDDANNQVKKNKRKVTSPLSLSEAAIAKRVQSRAAAYAATQDFYIDDLVGGKQGKVKSRRSSVGSTTSTNSDTVRAPGSTKQAKVKVEVDVGPAKDKNKVGEESDFKENTVAEMVARRQQAEAKKASPGKVKAPGSSPNKNAPPVLQPWSNPNLVIRTRRASAKFGESDSDVDVTSVTSNQPAEASPVRHSVVTPSKIKQRERENIFAALSPAKMIPGPEASASNTVPILEKMAAQLGTINPKTGMPTPTTQIIILRNAQGQTMYTNPAAAAVLLRSQGSQFVQNAQASPITTTASTARPQVTTARPQNPTQRLLQGSTLVKNQQGQTLLVPKHLLPSVLQSQGKTIVSAQGQAGLSQNHVRIATSPASAQRLGSPRLLTAAGVRPAVAQGIQGLQGKLNPTIVQQAIKQTATVASPPGKSTLIQVPGAGSAPTITLQPGQLITAQQLQLLQQTGAKAKMVPSTRQVSPTHVQRPLVATPGQKIATRTGQAVIQPLPAGTQVIQKSPGSGQPTLVALQNMPPGTPVSKLLQIQKEGQSVVAGVPAATSTPVMQPGAKIAAAGQQEAEEDADPIILSDDDDSAGQASKSPNNSGNIFDKISALSPTRIVALPGTQPSPRKHLSNIFEQMSKPLLTSGTTTAKGPQAGTSGISTVISMVRGTGALKASTSTEPQLVTGNIQNVLHIPELHVDIPSPGSIPRNPNDSTETVGYEESDEDHITIDSDSDDEGKTKKPIHVPEFREQLQQILQLKPQQLLKTKSQEEQTKLQTSQPTLVIGQARGAGVTSLPGIRAKLPASSAQTLLISQPQSTLVIPSSGGKTQQQPPRAQIILATSSQPSATTQSVVAVKNLSQGGLQYVQIQGQPQVSTASVTPNPQVKILQVLKQKLDQPIVQKQNEVGRSQLGTSPPKQIHANVATSVLPMIVVNQETEQQERQVTSVQHSSEDGQSNVEETAANLDISTSVSDDVEGEQAMETDQLDSADTSMAEPPLVTKSSTPGTNTAASFAGFQDQFAKFASKDQEGSNASPVVPSSVQNTSGTVVPVGSAILQQATLAGQKVSNTPTMRSVLLSSQKENVVESEAVMKDKTSVQEESEDLPDLPAEGVSLNTPQVHVVPRPKQIVQHRVIIRPKIPQIRMIRAPRLQQPQAAGAPGIVIRQSAAVQGVRPAAPGQASPARLASPPAVSKGDLPIDDEVIEALMSLKAPTQVGTAQSQGVGSPGTSIIQKVLQEPQDAIIINRQPHLSPQALQQTPTTVTVPASETSTTIVPVVVEESVTPLEQDFDNSASVPVESTEENDDFPTLEKEHDISLSEEVGDKPPNLVEEVSTSGEATTDSNIHNTPDEVSDEPPQLEPCVEAGTSSAAENVENREASVDETREVSSVDNKETDELKEADAEGSKEAPLRITRTSRAAGSVHKSETNEVQEHVNVRTRSRSRSQSVHSADSEADEDVEPPKKFTLTGTDSGKTVLSTEDEPGEKPSAKRITRRSIAARDSSAESQAKSEDLESSMTEGNLRRSIGRRSSRKSVDTPDREVVAQRKRGRTRKSENATNENEEMASEVEEKENEAVPPVVKRGRGRPRKSQPSESPTVEPAVARQARVSRTSSRAASVADSSSEPEDNVEVQGKRGGSKAAAVKQETGVKTSRNRSTRRSIAKSEDGSASEAEIVKSKATISSPMIVDSLHPTDSESDDDEVSFKARPKLSLDSQSGGLKQEVDRSLQPVSPTQQKPHSPNNERKGIFEQMTSASRSVAAPFRKKSWRDEMDLESGHIVPTREKGQTSYTSPSRVATNKPISSRSPPSAKSRHPSGPRNLRPPSPVRPGRVPASPPVVRAAPAKRGRPSSAGSDKQDPDVVARGGGTRASPVPSKRNRNSSSNDSLSKESKKTPRGGAVSNSSVAGQKGKAAASPAQQTRQKANTRGALKDRKRHTRSNSHR